MFIHLHYIDTNESVVVNTDYIVMVFDNVYEDGHYYADEPPMPGATLTISGHEGPVEVKESVADIERLMNRDRVYSTPTTKCV